MIALDPANPDAINYLAAADRTLISGASRPVSQPSIITPATSPPSTESPTSFANGRYQVKRFLGEGGKKKVYLAQDTLLDREVAFALIKT